MPDGFRGLGILSPDYWAPLALAGQFRDAYAGKQDETPVEVIGRLKPRLSVEAATAALTTWASRRRDLTAVPAEPDVRDVETEPGDSADRYGSRRCCSSRQSSSLSG